MKQTISPIEYQLLIDILNKNISASLSTISPLNRCHSNTIYYCFDNKCNLYFASDCRTEHAMNILENSKVSLAIWNIPMSYGQDHYGLQIEGDCRQLSGLELIEAWYLYIKRFPIFQTKIGNIDNISNKIVNMRLYRVTCHRIQLTNSKSFGNNIVEITL